MNNKFGAITNSERNFTFLIHHSMTIFDDSRQHGDGVAPSRGLALEGQVTDN